jgi:hypothetical protein
MPSSQQPKTFSVLSQINLINIIQPFALTSFLELYQAASYVQTFSTKTNMSIASAYTYHKGPTNLFLLG